MIVYLTLTIPRVMLFEAFLSFLGLGVEPPDVSWGLLANEGIKVITPVKIYWWLIVFPSLALGITLFALNFLGDRLRDALDPKTASDAEAVPTSRLCGVETMPGHEPGHDPVQQAAEKHRPAERHAEIVARQHQRRRLGALRHAALHRHRPVLLGPHVSRHASQSAVDCGLGELRAAPSRGPKTATTRRPPRAPT